jgi:hypothetical protein
VRERRLGDYARVALAGIRIFNGATGLLAPGVMAARTGVRPDVDAPVLYPWRMFGIRTILIGTDLLSRNREVRRHALRVAAIVHASDVVAASATLRSSTVPRKTAIAATAISSLNTVLALVASRGLRPSARGRM